MIKTVSKFVVAAALAGGVMAAQAANIPLSTGSYGFDGDVTKVGKSDKFNFTIASGDEAILTLDSWTKGLGFVSATLSTKAGNGWSSIVDTDITDGLFGAISQGQYRVQFLFDTSAVAKHASRGFSATLNVSAVPEPESYAMFLAGLGILGAIARRRKQA